MLLLISDIQICDTTYYHNNFGRICHHQVKYLQSEIIVETIQKSTIAPWTSTNITYGVSILY